MQRFLRDSKGSVYYEPKVDAMNSSTYINMIVIFFTIGLTVGFAISGICFAIEESKVCDCDVDTYEVNTTEHYQNISFIEWYDTEYAPMCKEVTL